MGGNGSKPRVAKPIGSQVAEKKKKVRREPLPAHSNRAKQDSAIQFFIFITSSEGGDG